MRFVGCWHCGVEGHSRQSCEKYIALVGGKGPDGKPKRPPPGYKGKYEEWVDQQRSINLVHTDNSGSDQRSQGGSDRPEDYSEDDDDGEGDETESESSEDEVPEALAGARKGCGCVWKKVHRGPKPEVVRPSPLSMVSTSKAFTCLPVTRNDPDHEADVERVEDACGGWAHKVTRASAPKKGKKPKVRKAVKTINLKNDADVEKFEKLIATNTKKTKISKLPDRHLK